MAHDINSALERLEKNLSELDSARSQVMQSAICGSGKETSCQP